MTNSSIPPQAVSVEPVNAVAPPTLLQFDPRKVPFVAGGVEGLPAVSAVQLTAQALRARFATPPAWTPELRRDPRMTDRVPAQAAVLVPIVQRPQGATVLLTERTSNLSTHSGQVAFPGGRVDPEDANIAAAALREAWEEVGLSAQYIEVLGNLPTYTTVTSFIVTPVVALVQPDFELTINPYEVAQAFEVPLAWLMDPANHRHHTVPAPDGTRRQWYSMPYQDGPDERFVWGATAGMLRNLYRFLAA
ncbi:CoA pyrophosphatase [Variovorax sp. YR566]|uniref:CoA pyrophosphatase n=1 Tax=Variovorax sp. YR566 TaxID=3450237 RepID=UPI003F7D37FD